MPEYIAESKPTIIDLDRRMFIRIFVTGLVIGVIAWGLTFLLHHYILQAWFCNEAASDACQSSTVYAGNISAVIVAVGGISALVRFGIFRPLLIVLASLITLWGLAGWLLGVAWLEALLWTAGLYAISYSVYAWLARIRQAVLMIIIVALVVLATRLVPIVLG